MRCKRLAMNLKATTRKALVFRASLPGDSKAGGVSFGHDNLDSSQTQAIEAKISQGQDRRGRSASALA